MRRFRSLVALGLLAFWLPASLHCELELAGVFSDCGVCQSQKDWPEQDNDADGCAIAHNGAYRLPSDGLLLKAPELGPWLVMMAIIPPTLDFVAIASLDATAASLEMVRRWQFRTRAAPPVRAPALLG